MVQRSVTHNSYIITASPERDPCLIPGIRDDNPEGSGKVQKLEESAELFSNNSRLMEAAIGEDCFLIVDLSQCGLRLTQFGSHYTGCHMDEMGDSDECEDQSGGSKADGEKVLALWLKQ